MGSVNSCQCCGASDAAALKGPRNCSEDHCHSAPDMTSSRDVSKAPTCGDTDDQPSPLPPPVVSPLGMPRAPRRQRRHQLVGSAFQSIVDPATRAATLGTADHRIDVESLQLLGEHSPHDQTTDEATVTTPLSPFRRRQLEQRAGELVRASPAALPSMSVSDATTVADGPMGPDAFS
jgi:hypothetical protein